MTTQYTPSVPELDKAVCQAHDSRTHVTIDRIRAALVRSTGHQLINVSTIRQFCQDVLTIHPTIANAYTFK